MKRDTKYVDKNGTIIKEHDIVLAVGKTKDGESVECFFILEFRWPSGISDYYFTPVNYPLASIDINFEDNAEERVVVGNAGDYYHTPHVLDSWDII